jgi:hypothetical protein
MNLVKKIEQFDINNIYFCEPIKNNIMNDGVFIRILYSTNSVVFNGIYLLISIHDTTCEKYYNKFKCSFNIENHKEVIDQLKKIEECLLKKIDIKNKTPQYKIYDQIKNGNVKVFNDVINKDNSLFILKISGIWETQFYYGLTYKFNKIN